MSSSINTSLQTGVWDRPQIIPFDSLFTTYSIEKVFEHEEIEQMNPILFQWRDLAKNHFLEQERERPVIANYMTDSPTITRRTAHVNLEQTPRFIYKTYYPNSSNLHPMATTMRAPMASLIQKTITDLNFDKIGVPKKGLFPLFEKELIIHLDERSINEAFIVCAEKINVHDKGTTRQKIKEFSAEDQSVLATQICQTLINTGLGDCTWENLQMSKENGKTYILDTETIEFELFIDKFGKGYEECANAVDDPEVKLSSCAKTGLTWFKRSSNLHRMNTFEDTADSFLEKMD